MVGEQESDGRGDKYGLDNKPYQVFCALLLEAIRVTHRYQRVQSHGTQNCLQRWFVLSFKVIKNVGEHRVMGVTLISTV